jgi:hypothetical protein
MVSRRATFDATARFTDMQRPHPIAPPPARGAYSVGTPAATDAVRGTLCDVFRADAAMPQDMARALEKLNNIKN